MDFGETASGTKPAVAPYSGGRNEQGMRHGRGICVYTDGTVYEGEWENDEHHGQGMCRFPSGNIYFGSFVRGSVEGEGCMLYSDGDFFCGTFRNSTCHGEGIYFSSGRETRGVWDRGVRVSGREVPLTSITSLAAQRANAAAFALLLKQFQTHFFFNVVGANEGTRSVSPARGRSPFGDSSEPTLRTAPPVLPTPQSPSTRQRHSDPARLRLPQQQAGEAVAMQSPMAIDESSSHAQPSLTHAYPQRTSSNLHRACVSPLPQGRTQGSGGGGPGLTEATMMFSFDGGDAAMEMMQTTVNGPMTLVSSADGTNLVQVGSASGNGKAPSLAVLFCCAGPVHNEIFSISSYLRYLLTFLVPYLSLPHLPCPFPPDTLDIEREYVVSGAALRRDFEVPTASIYMSAIGISCHIIAVALTGTREQILQYGGMTQADVAAPFALWITFAAFCAGYNSYTRLAHPLERLDRHFFPRLAAFVASTVDANSSVCIYTWDEDGGSKITNLHYHYRWQFWSLLVASMMAFASPVTRVIRGHEMFGSSSELASCVLSFLSLWIFAAGLTFYALKLTDMQREVLSQMKVLTKLAYLRNVSITRPTTQIKTKFHFDAPIDVDQPFAGFVGWYFARCHVLYSSTCANHDSRGAAMSVMFLLVTFVGLIACGDVVYATAANRIEDSASYYSSAHSIAGVLLVTWGTILLRYMNMCVLTQHERKRHSYLVDVAKMYHELHPSSSAALPQTLRPSSIIEHCGEMIRKHDRTASLFSIPIREGSMAMFAFLLMCSVVSIAVQLGQAIRISLR